MKKHAQTRRIVLIALLAVLALAVPAFAAESETRVIVLCEDGVSPADLESALAEVEGARYLWSYDAFFSGAAVDASPQALARLEALPGVAAVRPARSYDAPLSAEGQAVDEGLKLMGADKLWEQGWTGDGTVIAVLDTGLLVTHEAFADDSLVTAPAISREDVEAFAAKGRTAGQYVSRRIPFAYDYYDRDADVATTNSHGTHVTALAAGYAANEDGTVRFRGGAPGAQILSMKIFPNGASGGSDDAIVLRALEDAWNLGADVVNISISTGPGFVQDEALDGVYCRAFAQMAQSGVILCCAAGNENTVSAEKSWLPGLPSAAYTDYGTNCAPSSYRGTTAIGAASAGDGGAVPAEYSSWGPASGLHLTPSLLAFGGPSLSASASGDNLYRSDRGTSMASPSAAGMFATLLQIVRERGAADKAQSAQLALGLMESTAQILRDETGLPVSPRKQGAGLIDLSAAAASALVILDPLMEPGESADGSFTLNFTLRNLGGKAVTASLSAAVFTDAYEKQGDNYYSTLTARDITAGVTVEGGRSVAVPAGGEAEVSLTLTVNADLREELAAVFTNGFYVEGYVTATAAGQSVHGTFLGYCGDWEAAPVLEPLDFRDLQDAWYEFSQGASRDTLRTLEEESSYLPALGADVGVNLVFLTGGQSDFRDGGVLLGANAYAYAPHDESRFAMPSPDTDAGMVRGERLVLSLYAQRRAAGLVLLASDPETGTPIYASRQSWLDRSVVGGSRVLPAATFSWDGRDFAGEPVPGGTRVRVDVYAWLDTDEDVMAARSANKGGDYGWLLAEEFDAYRELSFPLTIDAQAPTVSAVLSGDALTLTFHDDQYLAYAAAGGGDGVLLGERTFFPEAAGESGTLTLRFPDGDYPDTLYIQAEDYAGNLAGWALDMRALAAEGRAEPERCAMLLLEDADLTAWYHDAVDYILDSGIMEPDGDRRFYPDSPATRTEIVTALHQANGSPAAALTASGLPFKDVSSRASFIGAVCWAYEAGLVTGETADTFAGDADVSRQQLAVMLWRCAKLNGTLGGGSGSLAAFPDRADVADWALEAMTWAVGQGLINGEDGKLNPDGPVTRAQAAQMLVRFLERDGSARRL